MSERDVAKEALKKKYLEDIAKDLFKESKGKIQFPEDVKVDENGKLQIDHLVDVNFLRVAVSYLANELANTKAELWLQSLKAEK